MENMNTLNQNTPNQQAQPIHVSLEFTPNPNTLKYTVNKKLLLNGALNLTSKAEADRLSPLGSKLLNVEGVAGVMIGVDFVTITKAENGDWDHVHKSSVALIQAHLESGEKIVNEDAQSSASSQESSESLTEIEQKICDILDNEVRPAVARDGGDITFDHFANGIVYLQLKGACSGCPSSTMTLKMGIEERLKQIIPEVKEVVSV